MVSIVTFVGCAARTDRPSDTIPHDAPSGGQTLAEMQDSLGSIPGITVTDASSAPPNIKGNTGYSIDLEVQPGYTVLDGPALVDFVVASVWSVREGYMPNAQIDISVSMPPGGVFDVAAAAVESGWAKEARLPAGERSTVGVLLNPNKDQGARNLERLGSWPGDVPDAPGGITAQE
ncbi:hypothetical protein ACIPV2_02120 [Microbacterium sp. NPDC089987]|uniref:hypothetical protein n=1 Tax=Microbacterium sp. NPDC089987 TaxID=3364202 RepID=UPI0038256728